MDCSWKVLAETRLRQNRSQIPIGTAACCLHRHVRTPKTHLAFLEGSVRECRKTFITTSVVKPPCFSWGIHNRPRELDRGSKVEKRLDNSSKM